MALVRASVECKLMLHALIPILGAGGSAAGEYFLKLYGNASSQVNIRTAVDSADNIILAGGGAGAIIGSNDAWVAKFSADGVLLWAVAVGLSGTLSLTGMAVDSSGDIFCVGNISTTGQLFKLSGSDGSMLARQTFTTVGNVGHVALDSSGQPHVTVSVTNTNVHVLKWQNDLTFIGQRKITPATGTSIFASSVAVDSSGNIFVLWRRSTLIYINKWNSALTQQWQYTLSDWGGAVGLACHGTDLLVQGRDGSPGSAVETIAKISSVPAVTWVRQILIVNSLTGGHNPFVDSAGAVYVPATYDATPDHGLLVKWNSGGVLQDQVIFKANTGSGLTGLYAGAVDSEGRIVVAGQTAADGAGNNDALLARIPSDFSMTGTYGNIDYETSAYTENAGVGTFTTTTHTEAAGDMTVAAGSLTVASLTGFTLEEFDLA